MTGLFFLSIFSVLIFYFQLSMVALSVHSLNMQHDGKHIIKVCHNKHCTRKGGGEHLLQVFRGLLPSASSTFNNLPTIESTGCLSQCDKGPNVCAVNYSNKIEKMYFGVSDATTASAVLDVTTGEEYPLNLLLAVDMISQAKHGKTHSEREEIFTSVITLLQKNQDPSTIDSCALGQAFYLRADARLETYPPNVVGAIADVEMALQILPQEPKAWRILASAEEANGNLEMALIAVKEWAKVDPSSATKAETEIDRLNSLL